MYNWISNCKWKPFKPLLPMNKTKKLIDELIEKRSKGQEFLKLSTQMKLLMKGIDTRKITDDTPDNEVTIKKIHEIAAELKITLNNK